MITVRGIEVFWLSRERKEKGMYFYLFQIVAIFFPLSLCSLLAPYISSGMFWEIMKLWLKGSKAIILDIPLLFEAKMDRWTAPIIVVWVDPETQVQRLMARDGIPEEQARNKINAQTALDWKKTKADIVIDNSGTIEETKLQFQEVLNQVTRPLTWKELALSREGVFWILISALVGVLVVQKNLK